MMLVAAFASGSHQPGSIPPVVWTAVLSAAGVLIGIFLFFRGFPLLRRKRFIQDTPVSTARGAAIGNIEIRGKAVGPYTLLSPVSALDCYCYRVEVWQAVDEGRRRRWKKRAHEMLSTPLFVQDETGRLLLDARDAEICFPPDADDQCDAGDVGELVRHFLQRRGITSQDPVRIIEHCIKPGDEIFVLGTLRQNDTPLDFLSPEAADLQRREVLDALHIPSTPPILGGSNPDLPVVLGKGAGNSLFLISRQSPREVIQDLASNAAMYIWGGATLALLCLAILIASIAR